MDIEKITLFDNYIKDRLSPEEKAGFDSKLESDKQFGDDFKIYINIVEGIKQHERDKLKRLIKGGAVHVKHKLIKWYIAAAAILIVLILPAYIIYYSRILPDSIYKNYRLNEKELGVELGASANADLQNAINEYFSGNVNSSLKLLKEMELENTHNDTVNYYIGACYLELSERKQALLYFSKLSNSTTNYFAIAKYNMALIYIKQNDFMDARRELNAIPQKGTMNTIGKKANMLMEEIR
jgi:hypothetical protein